MTKRILVTTVGVFSLALACTANAEIKWVGGASTDVFDEANWDLRGSSVTAIDENVTITDDVRIGPGPFAHDAQIPDLAGQVRLQIADGNRLTIDGSIISPVGNDGVGGEPGGDADPSNDGVTGPIVDVINGGQFNPFFIVNDVRLNIDGTSSATFGGGGNPINLSSIYMEPGAVLSFLAETPDAFTTEHLAKVFVGGAAAVDGVNIMLASDGGSGSVITAVPEPAFSVLPLIAAIALVFRKRR
ncbi:MAG: hypothetical protein KDB27_25500 [Planctomycetales bacterium]|nr:hypothetical protein [Planctomycetales bacterium]